MTKPKNDFEAWEAEEAERRRADYDKSREALAEKASRENAKQDAGVGVEDGSEDPEDDDGEEDDQ